MSSRGRLTQPFWRAKTGRRAHHYRPMQFPSASQSATSSGANSASTHFARSQTGVNCRRRLHWPVHTGTPRVGSTLDSSAALLGIRIEPTHDQTNRRHNRCFFSDSSRTNPGALERLRRARTLHLARRRVARGDCQTRHSRRGRWPFSQPKVALVRG